jgi:hypothetical protein
MSANTLGFGLGLRPVHYPEIFDGEPRIDWFEASEAPRQHSP